MEQKATIVYCHPSLPPEQIPKYTEKQAQLANELKKRYPEAASITGVRYFRVLYKYKGEEYLSEGYSRPSVPSDYVYKPSPNYHYLPYKWTNGTIVIDAPLDYPRMFGKTRKGKPIAVPTMMFKCEKKPKYSHDIKEVLEKANFAAGRLIQVGDENWRVIAFDDAEEVKYVLVEKCLCETLMIETHIDQASTIVTRPKCHLCQKEMGFGSRCQTCKKEACATCSPYQWQSNRGDIPDTEFLVRIYVRSRCDVCLPFVK